MSNQRYLDDRSWMLRRIPTSGSGVSPDFEIGVQAFVEFAFKHGKTRNNCEIRCPCRGCANLHWKDGDTVAVHLLSKGFAFNYARWVHHGESDLHVGDSSTSQHNMEVETDSPDRYDCDQMVLDAIGPLQFEWGTMDDNLDDVEDEDGANEEMKGFYELLKSLEEPLYEGHTKHSKLSALTRLLHHKSEHGQTERGFNDMIAMFKEFSPDGIKLPNSYYDVKKLIKKLGLGYERIDACEKDCVLYRGEYTHSRECPKCKSPRYLKKKPGCKGKDVPCKVLRYFPIIPRLKRLYMSKKTAEHMIWHTRHTKVEGELRHPSDGAAWKEFDATHPSFAADDRHVRLGIATDGFNPFSGKVYSCWPVISVVYNLPPFLCMRDAYMYLTLLIPGDKSPTKDIGVYLQPLIDDMKLLWNDGVFAYDAHTEKSFKLRAALMWTISDFPAYGMIASWCVHGVMSCPICMTGDMAFVLKHSRKVSYFGCHRRFLPVRHRFRSMTKEFNGKKEPRQAPKRKAGSYIKAWLASLVFPTPGKQEKNARAPGYGQSHTEIWRINLGNQLGRTASMLEKFKLTHSKGGGVGDWATPRCEEIANNFQQAIETQSQVDEENENGETDRPVTPRREMETWIEQSGGRKRNRVLGLGPRIRASDVCPRYPTHGSSGSSGASASGGGPSIDEATIKRIIDEVEQRMLARQQESSNDIPRDQIRDIVFEVVYGSTDPTGGVHDSPIIIQIRADARNVAAQHFANMISTMHQASVSQNGSPGVRGSPGSNAESNNGNTTPSMH